MSLKIFDWRWVAIRVVSEKLDKPSFECHSYLTPYISRKTRGVWTLKLGLGWIWWCLWQRYLIQFILFDMYVFPWPVPVESSVIMLIIDHISFLLLFSPLEHPSYSIDRERGKANSMRFACSDGNVLSRTSDSGLRGNQLSKNPIARRGLNFWVNDVKPNQPRSSISIQCQYNGQRMIQ